MNTKLLQLAKIIMKLSQTETDKGTLVADVDLAEGVEVFVEGENGELVAAADGEYITEDKIIVVAEGKVTEIKEKETEPTNVVEQETLEEDPAPATNEADKIIEELNAKIVEKDVEIENLNAKIAELVTKLEEANEKAEDFAAQIPAFKENKNDENTHKSIAEVIREQVK